MNAKPAGGPARDSTARIQDSVLIVGNFLSGSRITRFVCEDLASQLTASGWRVLTASAKLNRVSRLLDMVATAWRCRRQYAVGQVDVYSGASFFWAEVVSAVLRCAGKPYVLTLHGGRLPEFATRWPRRVRRLLRSAAAVTSPSRYLCERLRLMGVSIRVLPNPIEMARYPFRHRRALCRNIVWLRAFHRIYNPMLAPRVLSILCEEYPETRLVMIGPDKADGSLQETKRAAVDLGVADRIIFAGGILKEDVSGWLSKGDVFLNTPNIDNTPVSILEAMACGLCVVSTNVGGLPYLMEDRRTALLVPPDDAESMAAAVRMLFDRPDIAEQLSLNGRQMAETFDWKAILPVWEGLLRDVVRSGATPSEAPRAAGASQNGAV
ncbi:MAG: glycosyltransferase family 4 protein [Nitrospirota bacterium]